jgi:hypothetical protein
MITNIVVQVPQLLEEPNARIVVNYKEEPKAPSVEITLNMVRTLSGDLLIKDHRLYDIIVKVKEQKVVVKPKKDYDDVLYRKEKEFFDFMVQKGIIDSEDIEGGSIHGSLQAKYDTSELEPLATLQWVLYVIFLWVEQERPKQEFNSELFKKGIERLTNTDEMPGGDPEKLSKKVDDLKLARTFKPYTYNFYDVYPYQGIYYLEEEEKC